MTSHSESGAETRTQGQDYDIDALQGTIRLNSLIIIAIAYTIAEYNPDSLTFLPSIFEKYRYRCNHSYDIRKLDRLYLLILQLKIL